MGSHRSHNSSDHQNDFHLKTSSLPVFLYLFSFAKPPTTWRSIFGYAPFRWAIAFIVSLIASAAVPALDLIYGIWTEKITAANATPQTIRAASDRAGYIMIAVGFSQLLLFWLSMYMFMVSSEELTSRLRVVYVSSLLAKNPDFFSRHGAGELSSRICVDIEAIRIGLGEKMAYVGQSAGIMIASTTLAFVRAPRIAGVLFPIIPIVLGLFTFLGITSERISSPASMLEGQVATFMEQLLSAPRIVHAFGAARPLLRKLDAAFLLPLSKCNKRRAMIRSVELSSVFAMMLWLYGIFFAWGAHQISEGHTTVGVSLTAFWSFVNTFFAIANLVPHLGSILQAFASLRVLRRAIEDPPAIDVRDEGGLKITKDVDRIPHFRFEDVTFAYPSRPAVAALSGVTLDVEANKVTAFVGPSGSGKSTLLALLLRELDPESQETAVAVETTNVDVEKTAPSIRNSGRIMYAGRDLRSLNVADYRSEIGVISQHLHIYTGSVLDNVAFGLTEQQSTIVRGQSLRIRVKQALVKSQAWDFVSRLPQGMDTQLRGGHSNMLSGGQRQRLALARALIREPTVLCLDEATSALDSNTEESIRSALEVEQRTRNMTCCVIAHRLSTIRHASKIVVLDAGKIVDQGTHEELMQVGRADETYRRMVLKAASRNSDTTYQTLPLPEHDDTFHSIEKTAVDLQAVGKAKEGREANAARPLAPDLAVAPVSTNANVIVPSKHAFAHLWSKSVRKRWALLVGSLAALIGSGTLPVSGLVTGEGIAALSSGDLMYVRAEGYFWALIFLALGLAAVILYSLQGYTLDEASSHVGLVLKRDSLETILGQDMTYFDFATRTNGIEGGRGDATIGSAANLSQHPNNIATGISVALGQSILCLGNVLVCFGIGLGLSWKMALVAFSPLLLLPPLSYITITRLQGAETHYSDRAERCSAYLSEQIDCVRTVTAFGRQPSVLALFKDKAEVRGLLTSRRSLRLGTLTFAAGQSFMLIPAALIFWYSGRLLAGGTISIAAIYGVFEVQIIAGFGLARLFTLVPDISRAITSTRVVASWLSMACKKEGANLLSADANDSHRIGNITFENVQLCYPQRPDYPALRGISMTIAEGSTIALVGTSGSGKSTVLSLLSKFYEPTHGRILLGGKDLSTLDVHKVRARCALVSQDAVLFQGTVRENIALGATNEATEENIRFACEQAGVLDFVQGLPEGFDTEIGLKGMELSGGQRQRLCIARALVRSPEVLLLDETTSALDAESEAVVQAALDKASHGRTTVVVAHRLSTVRHADCIYVLEEGRIVESGTHDQLLKAKGRYLELIEAQL